MSESQTGEQTQEEQGVPQLSEKRNIVPEKKSWLARLRKAVQIAGLAAFSATHAVQPPLTPIAPAEYARAAHGRKQEEAEQEADMVQRRNSRREIIQPPKAA